MSFFENERLFIGPWDGYPAGFLSFWPAKTTSMSVFQATSSSWKFLLRRVPGVPGVTAKSWNPSPGPLQRRRRRRYFAVNPQSTRFFRSSVVFECFRIEPVFRSRLEKTVFRRSFFRASIIWHECCSGKWADMRDNPIRGPLPNVLSLLVPYPNRSRAGATLPAGTTSPPLDDNNPVLEHPFLAESGRWEGRRVL